MSANLTFIRSYEHFSHYRRSDGTDTYLGHGTMRPWTHRWDSAIYGGIWGEWEHDFDHFVGFVRTTCGNRWIDLYICEDCGEVHDYAIHIDGHGYICQGCFDHTYVWCYDCDDPTSEWSTINDHYVCEWCRDNEYSWCEDCDEYYRNGNEADHRHGGCDCEAPAQTFTMPNNGDGALRNDERVTIALASGVISTEGMLAIQKYLRDQQVECWYSVMDTMEPQWQNRQGNFPKRLSRAIYKSCGTGLTPEQMSQVGNLARDHSTAVSHDIEITRDLNLPPEEFAHEDSCWWQSYSESRCALKNNGGFGLRAFDDYGDVAGRAWVMPLRNDNGTMVPTFDAMDPDAYIVFNGYGTLNGYTACRIVSYMAGMTYRKITFTCSPMYVNNDTGYLVAPEHLAADYTDGRLSLHVDDHARLYYTEQQAA